jgi:hypothetical protein
LLAAFSYLAWRIGVQVSAGLQRTRRVTRWLRCGRAIVVADQRPNRVPWSFVFDLVLLVVAAAVSLFCVLNLYSVGSTAAAELRADCSIHDNRIGTTWCTPARVASATVIQSRHRRRPRSYGSLLEI